MKLTAIIEREGDGYVSLCPELDIASQGDRVEQARDNLREALGLFNPSSASRGCLGLNSNLEYGMPSQAHLRMTYNHS